MSIGGVGVLPTTTGAGGGASDCKAQLPDANREAREGIDLNDRFVFYGAFVHGKQKVLGRRGNIAEPPKLESCLETHE